MKLRLSYPVSANRYWRTVVNKKTQRAMTFVSKEAEAFKDEARLRAMVAGIRKPLAGPVELRFRLVPRNLVCMDLDNALKVSIDALKGIVFGDDSQVFKIVAERGDADPAGAYLEVEILPLALSTPLGLTQVFEKTTPAPKRDTGGLPF